MEKDIVAKWLKKYVGPAMFCDCFWGYYDFQTGKVNQNVGAVYGIWMKATTQEIHEYVQICNQNIKPLKGYIPLYWGKDVSPCQRLVAHFETSPGTKALNLIETNYANRELIFGCVLTKEYAAIEKRLHEEYPPLLGSNRAGRSSTKRKIIG